MIYNAVLPQVVPSWVNNIVYRFDINLRASAVLGFVGAGGIGILLQSDLKNATRYPLGMATALALAAVIIIVETFSRLLRTHLQGVETNLTREQRDPKTPTLQIVSSSFSPGLRPPLTRERASFFAVIFGGVLIWLWCMWQVGLFTLTSVRPFGFSFPLPQFIAIPTTAVGQITKYWPNWDTVGISFAARSSRAIAPGRTRGETRSSSAGERPSWRFSPPYRWPFSLLVRRRRHRGFRAVAAWC